MKNRRLFTLLSFLLILGLALAACGGGEAETPTEEAAPAEEVEAPTEEAQAPAEEAAAPTAEPAAEESMGEPVTLRL
ncbi:MAG: hypothetical protein ACK2U5_01700, partial [Candidatus Promineifilaceae bacterium]